jgi:hypothetical protein
MDTWQAYFANSIPPGGEDVTLAYPKKLQASMSLSFSIAQKVELVYAMIYDPPNQPAPPRQSQRHHASMDV